MALKFGEEILGNNFTGSLLNFDFVDLILVADRTKIFKFVSFGGVSSEGGIKLDAAGFELDDGERLSGVNDSRLILVQECVFILHV